MLLGVTERAPDSQSILAQAAHQELGRAGAVLLGATVLSITGSVGVLAIGPLVAGWLRAQGAEGVIIFTIAFVVLGALSIAPTYTTSIIAGWTFGFRAGFPAIILGTVGGGTLCYAAVRWIVGQRVAGVFRDHPKWEIIRRALLEENALKTLWIVFLLRLSPVLPFGTTNALLATTGVRLPVFVVGTVLGLMPRTGLVALAAAGAERLDFRMEKSWYLLAGGLAATGLCILAMAIIGKHAMDRATRRIDARQERAPI